jgi:dTDP-4-amino-4,6-dideoxygalactose transaminase
MNVPFSPPRIDQKIIDEVTAALQSGWITTGPRTKAFEKKITEYCGHKNTLCLNSATAGLEVMLRWFGVCVGDEVILPAYTYSATANVVIHCGAIPVLVDTNADDFNMDPEKLKAAITEKTKVIMPVDFAGFPCDYAEINAIAKEMASVFIPATDIQKKLNRILVLSDAAHSFGAEYNGKKTGTLTDVSVFSFHAVKNLTTAEGGAIALNLPEPFDNEAIYKFLCMYTLHGQNKDALAKTQKGAWRYDILEAGYKCNMTDISAAIGLIEIERYDNDTTPKRKYIVEAYDKAFSKFAWAQIPIHKTENKLGCYHLYPLRIKNVTEAQRDAIIQKIANLDVAVNVHFIPIAMLSFYKNKGYDISKYPITYDNYSREISLPIFYNMTDEQLQYVIKCVNESVNEIIKS